jgi:hypothetical protein
MANVPDGGSFSVRFEQHGQGKSPNENPSFSVAGWAGDGGILRHIHTLRSKTSTTRSDFSAA